MTVKRKMSLDWWFKRNLGIWCFDARVKIKRMIQWYLEAKLTKRCVRIAYGNETVEKWVKMGKVGLLPGISRTQVKAHARRHDPANASPSPHTQNLKNIPVYERTELRTHECKLHRPKPTHARTQTEVVLRHFQGSITQNQSQTCSYPSQDVRFSSKPIPQQNPSIYTAKNTCKLKRETWKWEKKMKNL